MRIIIDLQACQSGSAQRGIGRYSFSLVDALVQLNTQHEIFIALSGAFPETIRALQNHFLKFIPKDRIVIWHTPFAIHRGDQYSLAQIHNAQLLREAFFAQFNPDFVLVTSLFESFYDGAVTGVGSLFEKTPTAIILYDLIPMLYPQSYLENSNVQADYYEKIRHLQQADLLLSISESARDEAKIHLEPCPPIEVISSAAERHFQKIDYTPTEKAKYLNPLNLKKEFLMYTGGLDFRKNIERLIEAFSKLPQHLLDSHQLAIVCAIKPNERQRLLKQVQYHGLTKDQVIITGYVEEDQLVALYNCCKGFIFPSIHEGFGLPILEAMQCGAPVIGSNRSSLPEAIGYPEALFDPENITEMTKKIEQLLTDEAYRKRLIEHAKHQVTLFSWKETARKTLRALESSHSKSTSSKVTSHPKLKLAFCAPLPPEKTGIAEYSQQLLSSLSEYYDIEVIVHQPEVSMWIQTNYPVRSVEWFMHHPNEYQRVLYHFENSTCYAHQFECINKIPGVVVLHDFYFSTMLSHLERTTHTNVWSKALYESHGYDALFARYHSQNLDFVKKHYPCNQQIIQSAVGIIVHEEDLLHLAQKWLNEPHDKPWFKIPFPKLIHHPMKSEDTLMTTETHHPITRCAQSYFEAIEKSYDTLQPVTILKHMQQVDKKQTFLFLESLTINQPPRAIKQLMIDITEWKPRSAIQAHMLRKLIHHPPTGYRVEPVYRHRNEPFFRYARQSVLHWLEIPKKSLVFQDDIISTRREDVYLSFSPLRKQSALLVDVLQRRGVRLAVLTADQTMTTDDRTLQKILAAYFPFYGWNIENQVTIPSSII